jgi:hypothetical protein
MKGPLMTGGGVSTIEIVKFPESIVVLPDLRKMFRVKFPLAAGFPLKTPCRFRVKPLGKPLALQTRFRALVELLDVNLMKGFGEEEDGG